MTRTPHTSKIFGLDMAAIVDRSLASAGGVTPITLLKRTPRRVAHDSPAHGSRAAEVEIFARGTFQAADRNGVQGGEVTLLGASLVLDGERVAPEVGDAVEVGGLVYELDADASAIKGDPAGASWSFRVVGPGRAR